ncbi:MAG: xanthine dehydrogenase accessory protein XdhC [Candidatus Obscuribacterales bacterium]|nr:xanthine dehydrogenase accessory protein XdhC [Candidatus Obscuribacterales bacterium]
MKAESGSFFEKLQELLQSGVPFVAVTVVDVQGSVPQDSGSKMLVTSEGHYLGTVGGGKVEKRAIEEAQSMLNSENGRETKFVNWALDRDIGMTCGGSMKLFFEPYNLNTWKIVIFGAGHVANALIDLLVKLDCHVTCIDPRQEWLDKLPKTAKLKTVLSPNMPDMVKSLDEDSFVMCITMGHTTDKPILLEILKQGRKFPYLGVIGSKAKAERLKKDVLEAGLPAEMQNAFYCPIGIDIGSNHPQEIAISVIAQLIQERDKAVKSAN